MIGLTDSQLRVVMTAARQLSVEKRDIYLQRSMNDFARRIAAGEKFPSLPFGFEPFDPTVLVGHLPMPESVKRAIR